MQGIRKELTEKIDETQADLQEVKTSFNTQTKDLTETITDTREHLHNQINLFQDNTRTILYEIQ
jgi:DNA-binding transcriptional regulator GbsR (MarR family)